MEDINIASEDSSQIVVEVSMIFLQQGMHWYNVYDESYIMQGKMKFMYFQWLQQLDLNRIRMTYASLFIVYSALSFFCHMSAISQELIFLCPFHTWMYIVCGHAWLRVCVCALVWMCVHCLWMCMSVWVCLGVSVSVCAWLSRRFSWLMMRVWLRHI